MRSDRRWVLAAPPDELWAAATSLHRYRSWWPWLRSFEADGFEPGARWDCVVKPPLPYAVRMTITLQEVRAPSLVRATVQGDVDGHAELLIRPDGEGSEARLVSYLAPAHGALQAFARVARPLVRYGHDWVLDHGARQFTASALARAPGDIAAHPDPDPDPGGTVPAP